MRLALHLGVVALLTVMTQLGGLAWALAALLARRKGMRMPAMLVAFGLLYSLIWGAAQATAPAFGRVPVPCTGEPLRMQSPLYCVLMRNFVTPEMRDVARDAALAVAAEHPGTVTLALDGSLPFLNGLPLFPHLSHDEGEKLDFAFFYADAAGYAPGETASPLGYFAFERAGEEQCPPAFPSLRWDMGWFRPFLDSDLRLEPARTASLIRVLMADPRVDRIFVEPPLAAALGVAGDKLRFQGCRAARHDDHIHIQL